MRSATAGVVDAWATPARCRGRGADRCQRVRCDRVAAVRQRVPSVASSLELLHGEGEPALQLGIELGLLVAGRSARAAASRTARSRAGRRRVAATAGSSRSSAAVRSARQMLRPSMTPSDSTSPSGSARQDRVELLRRAHEIDVQAGDRKRQRGIEVVAERRRSRWPA